jgi:hypothetical protein
MTNKIIVTPFFESRFKRFSKKFHNLKNEIANLGKQLEEDHSIGVSLGGGLYKIRLASKDKASGKSGGFRIITYSVVKKGNSYTIYLIILSLCLINQKKVLSPKEDCN